VRSEQSHLSIPFVAGGLRRLPLERLSPVKEDRKTNPTPIQLMMGKLREKRKKGIQSPKLVIVSDGLQEALDQLENDSPPGYCYGPEDSCFDRPSTVEPEKLIDPELQRRIREAMKEVK